MVDEAGWNVSVTEERYLNMWKNEVWPIVGRNGYWEMEDGATSHTTVEVMVWLNAKFRSRVISRKAEVEWPPYSPDLNPLDYIFWSYPMIHVR